MALNPNGRRAKALAAKRGATDERLAGLSLPEGPAWAVQARASARDRLAGMGLPMRRDEYWRWTDPTSLTSQEAPKAALPAADEASMFDRIERARIVFVDGILRPEESDALDLEGVEITRLADAADIHWAQDLYGVLEAAGQSPVERPMAAMNTAAATDGLLIRVDAKAERPVNLIYRHEDESSDAVLHHVVKLEEGADFTLLESGPAAARFNKVMEVDVAPGASFHHVRTQGRDHERRAVTHIFARVAEGAAFKSFTLTVNGVLTRNEVVIDIAGDDAVAHVAGAALGDGKSFLHDDTVFVTHGAERCESRQVFKKVLRNGATGVFQGKILVKEGAQKTDGYQISQGLLLDEDSVFLAKPELEIYADDVQCSHGSTSGALDETALYYLRSRGLPKDQAQDLLTLAFVAEALDEIDDERIRDDLRERLAGWLHRRR